MNSKERELIGGVESGKKSSLDAINEKMNTRNISSLDLGKIEIEYFNLVKSGEMAKLKQYIMNNLQLNINCIDYQGLLALNYAVNNEDVDMVQYLISLPNIDLMDTVLHAIVTENVDITTLLLDALKARHPDLEYQSYPRSREFSPDMTPLLLAAQKGIVEIIHLLKKRKHSIIEPHFATCMCNSCKQFIKKTDIDLTSQRLNAYRAISNPYFICLTSNDPFLTAFRLTAKLEECAKLEKEFMIEYETLSENVRQFAVDLLSQCKHVREVEQILKIKNGSNEPRVKYPRLQLALDFNQKEFVANSSVQKLLTAHWYGQWATWARYELRDKVIHVFFRVILLPIVCITILIAPDSHWGKRWRCPLNLFINELASYIIFLILLFTLIRMDTDKYERGPPTTGLEIPIIFWIFGFVFITLRRFCLQGCNRYLTNWWNWYDIFMNILFILTLTFWFKSWIEVNESQNKSVPRHHWPSFDSTLIHEALLCVSAILAIGKLIYYFQQSSRLGPLQVSLRKMLVIVTMFLLGWSIVILSLSVCMTKLYAPYKGLSYTDAVGRTTYQSPAFTTLETSMASFFWAMFGLSDVDSPKIVASSSGHELLHGKLTQHNFTQLVGTNLFGVYHIVMIVVFVNILVAVLTNSFQKVVDNADIEWKFVRTKQCITYVQKTPLLPSPFNLIPNWNYFGELLSEMSKARRIKDPQKKRPIHKLLTWLPFCYVEEKEGKFDATEYQDLIIRISQRYLRNRALNMEVRCIHRKPSISRIII